MKKNRRPAARGQRKNPHRNDPPSDDAVLLRLEELKPTPGGVTGTETTKVVWPIPYNLKKEDDVEVFYMATENLHRVA